MNINLSAVRNTVNPYLVQRLQPSETSQHHSLPAPGEPVHTGSTRQGAPGVRSRLLARAPGSSGRSPAPLLLREPDHQRPQGLGALI